MFDDHLIHNRRLRRIGVTAAAALVVLVGMWLPVPEATMPGASYYNIPTQPLSIGTLGLLPFMIAFVAVELLGLVRRDGSELVRTSDRPAWMHRGGIVGGLLLAVAGAGLCYEYWFVTLPNQLPGGVLGVTNGLGLQVTVVTTLVAGAALYYALADAVTRWGLGNGFAVVVGTGIAVDAYWAYRDFGGWLQSMSFQNLDVFAVLGNIFGVAVVILATLWMLYRLEEWVGSGDDSTAGEGPSLDVPLSGIVPFVVAKTALATVGTYLFARGTADVAALLRPTMRTMTIPSTWYYFALSAFAAVCLTLVASIAFYRTGWRLNEWLSGDGETRRFRRAVAATVGYVLLLVTIDFFGGQLVRSLGVASTALGTAIVCDLLEAWRFRRQHENAVAVETLHRNGAVGGALAKLDRAGIEAHAAGRCFRGMLQIFGAFAPIEVWVPTDDAEEAGEAIEVRGDEA